jgi:hypothetical protein
LSWRQRARRGKQAPACPSHGQQGAAAHTARQLPSPAPHPTPAPHPPAEALAAQRAELATRLDAVNRALEAQLKISEQQKQVSDARSEELHAKFEGIQEFIQVGGEFEGPGEEVLKVQPSGLHASWSQDHARPGLQLPRRCSAAAPAAGPTRASRLPPPPPPRAPQRVQESMDEASKAREDVARENAELRHDNALLERQVAALKEVKEQEAARMAALDELREKIEAQASRMGGGRVEGRQLACPGGGGRGTHAPACTCGALPARAPPCR